MNDRFASAVFSSYAAAGDAVTALHGMGVPDAAISVLVPQRGESDPPDTERDGTRHGLLWGGALGAGVGVATLAIPGIGPLTAAGAIAVAAIPTFAAAGASLGTLVAILIDYGLSPDVAARHAGDLRGGVVLLLVDINGTGISVAEVKRALEQHGGRESATVE